MSAATDLLLATNNSKKLKEIRAILGDEFRGRILCAADFPGVIEPEETGDTFAANAKLKADYYRQATGLVTLADDSGLVVDALGGRPGVYSARYAPTDAERIAKLLGELADVPDDRRTARFVCAMCVSTTDDHHIEVEGILEGAIGHVPSGSHGFGYDPIFVVSGHNATLADLDPALKNSISHRASAMKKLRPHLLAVQE